MGLSMHPLCGYFDRYDDMVEGRPRHAVCGFNQYTAQILKPSYATVISNRLPRLCRFAVMQYKPTLSFSGPFLNAFFEHSYPC